MELVFSGGIANILMASCLSYVVLLLSFTTSLSAPQNTAPPTAMRSSLVRIDDSTDLMALLSFKSSVSDDPFGVLASWNESLHFCRWRGVICGGTRHPERVTALDLQSLGLGGSISPSLANLTFLRRLNLANNQFSGHIPEELGHLRRLRYLNLSFASLVGVIPTTLSHCSLLQVISLGGNKLRGGIPEGLRLCSKLKILSLWGNMLVGDIPLSFANLSSLIHLDLSNNSLTGEITHSLGDLSALTYVDLSSNRLTGGIPLSFGNLSSLVHLDLSQNDLVGGIPTSLGSLSLLTLFDLSNNHFVGSIPSSLGSLSSLTKLYLSDNNLAGAIPSSLWNLSSLIRLAIQDNELSGTLPSNMCENLHALDRLIMYNNHFHGPIPVSLSNATTLLLIDLSLNEFTGIFPQHLGNLQNLVTIILADNRLEAGDWSFLKSLTNCSRLRGLQIDRNVLGGTLPSFVTNLSTTLTWLSMGGNQISGGIPGDIERLVRLTLLDLGPNLLTGAIPPSIGRLQSLNILDLNTNQLSKEIPPILGNLTQLDQLYLGFNAFSGSIPVSLGNCQYLEYLSLDYNNLSGTIPKEVVGITSLSILLGLSHNLLTGSLPLEVGSLNNLAVFDVSENRLSGGIPNTLGDCHILEYLVMKGNFFNGSIPSSLQNLKGLQLLDLSHNNLTGHIPEFLASFQFLQQLNLSFNNFEGEVPKDGIFGNVSAVSVLGNDELCGGNPKLNLPPCSLQTHRKRHWPARVTVIISVSSALFCSIFLIYLFVSCYWPQSSRIKSIAMRFMKEKHIRVSYGELLRATNGFSSANLIGVGSFGSVYRGTMDCEGEKIVAVKVLNLQQRGASRSFTAECEALRNIRHRNLVKILTSCSSVDYQGNEFKALVFEFIPNESLDKWLHPEANEQSESRNLSLVNRLNIAIDVASALDYLHHHGLVPIVHCDLKPSNILLDDSMTAYVGDFGLARFLTGTISNSSCDSTSTIGLKGSVGYVAPEYGMANKVSTQGDVYSYGILLLEMFTGRRPTDELFKEGLSLHKYVELAFGERIEDVMDPHLFLRKQDGETSKNIREKAEECVRSVLRMGLLCSKESPLDRMTMADVTKKLHAIKGAIP